MLLNKIFWTCKIKFELYRINLSGRPHLHCQQINQDLALGIVALPMGAESVICAIEWAITPVAVSPIHIIKIPHPYHLQTLFDISKIFLPVQVSILRKQIFKIGHLLAINQDTTKIHKIAKIFLRKIIRVIFAFLLSNPLPRLHPSTSHYKWK